MPVFVNAKPLDTSFNKRMKSIAKRVPKRIKEMQKPGPCVTVYKLNKEQAQAIESQANSAGVDA